MKNKTINSKIEALNGRIKSIESKAENAKKLKESGIFQSLESDLEAITVLQKDVQNLKDLLKTKTLELEEGIVKLRKSSKAAGKSLKKEKKPSKPHKAEKIRKEKSPANSTKTGGKKKAVKTIEKPVKPKK